MELSLPTIEKKWQKRWEEARLFEVNPAGGEKFYLTAAFPYPNSPQHIGHGRTYTTTDVYARYLRLRGRNVLFPMGFHVTGTPILGMAKRLAARDEELLHIFEKIYHIPREKAAQLTDPMDLVTYFSKEIEAGMKEMGFSIDWRRKFYSYDRMFNKFIQWQFRKLREKNYIKKGSHPVAWCPSCNNAVSSHDTEGDKDPELEEVVVLKFRFKDGFALATTYRPETLFGVTNMWYHPDAKIAKVKLNGEIYYLALAAAELLSSQLKPEILETLPASIFKGQKCINPINGDEAPFFPATFVQPEIGTGVVMSVPAHAPYDYLALRDLGLADKVNMRQVIALPGFGQFPAKEMVEKMGVKDQNDPRAEEATREVYRKECHEGKMVTGAEYLGLPVMKAKDRVRDDLVETGKAFTIYHLANAPIRCRCTAPIVVKSVENQWFIDYGSPAWKELTKECLEKMRILPEKTTPEYYYTIDWLKEKACTRAAGLGTHFPFDETQMIEALSDSTIYMAFYTISHHLKELDPEKFDEAFFDYILLGKGAEHATEKMRQIREEFLYWYPLDSRHSATDLVHNHLTFLIFNHVAIFPPELWPKQIVTNGFVLMDGSKMSKSMGNILPLRQAIRAYGADPIRLCLVSGAELPQDTDFNQPAVAGIISRMRQFYSLLEEALAHPEYESAPDKNIDRWFYSRLHNRVRLAATLYENFEHRTLTQEIFYQTINDISWYAKRTDKLKLREFFEYWVLLMAPIMPHFCEEVWSRLGEKRYVEPAGLVSNGRFPHANENKIHPRFELAEELVKNTREDIDHILKLLTQGKRGKADVSRPPPGPYPALQAPPAKIYLFAAAEWKRTLYRLVHAQKSFDKAMKLAMQDEEIKKHGKEVASLCQYYAKNVNYLSEHPLSAKEETEALRDARDYLERELKSPVEILEEDSAPAEFKDRAAKARPGKPSILVV